MVPTILPPMSLIGPSSTPGGVLVSSSSSMGIGPNPHHLSVGGGAHLSGPLSSGSSSVSSGGGGTGNSNGGGGGGKSSHGHGGQGTPKKPRLVFTDLQRRTLQAIFKETKRPSKEMQITISQQLGLELSTVGNFFMNARRRSQDKWMEDVPSGQGHHHRQQQQQQDNNDGGGNGSASSAASGGGGGGGSSVSAGSKNSKKSSSASSNAMPVLTMGSNVIVSCT